MRLPTMRLMTLLLTVLIMLPTARTLAQAYADETPAKRDARMKWWREARFGMFIHWGVYAVPAGTFNGAKVPDIGEWIMNNANIPVDEYESFAREFNPVAYDPAEWVQVAKDAGVKYIVITSKHHDGFCLFDTRATEWDVVDASPYGKDLLKPLADECRKHGLKFCTYYSIMDWHHPAQAPNDKNYNPTIIKPGRKQEYIDDMKTELNELLASCNPEVLWFDGEWPDWWTENDGRNLYAFLRRLKPQLIINNRIGKGRNGMEGLNKDDAEYVGDFGTPEQQIPATGIKGDWETCMTINDTWGYKSDDENWKSTEKLLRNLIDIASKGGNYLLNVGPKADGTIPQESIDRLHEIGKWLKVNGESIYATTASPTDRPTWGRITAKANDDGTTTLYLHVFDWPADGKLPVAVTNKVTACYLLADPGRTFNVDKAGDGLTVSLKGAAPDSIASVVVVELEGHPQVMQP